jgi:hypothetical protein
MAFFDDLLSGVYSASVAEVTVLVREVRVRIGVLPRPVTVRIYYDARRAEPYEFETDAVMKTADDRGAQDCARFAPSEGEALRRAVRMLTEAYDEAVRRGELPEDSWLVTTFD